MRIRVVQCLCPSRHSLMALGVYDDAMTGEEAITQLRDAVRAGLSGGDAKLGAPPMNHWCGLCGATNDTWKFELGVSKEFESLEAAMAEMARLMEEQIITRRALDELGLSYDARRKRNMN